jgi:hypothetical protein
VHFTTYRFSFSGVSKLILAALSYAGINNTSEKFISGVIDTIEQFFGVVVDTGDKF